MRRSILLFCITVFRATFVFSQNVAVNTDLCLDVLQTPNIGFEMVTGEKYSMGINVFGNYNPWNYRLKMMGVQPEIRYWLGRRPMHDYFVGIGGIVASYDIHWKGKVYEGYGAGVGLTFGYVLYVAKRINIDIHAGFGIIGYRHKEFYENDHYDDYTLNGGVQINAKGYYLLPTRIGISLTYILK